MTETVQATQGETRALKYELEVAIDATVDAVWEALVEETDAWWLPDFHMVGEGSVVTLEARAGGLLLEAQPDGGSLLWYTVVMCRPGQSLHLVGHIAPAWGGPATSMLELALSERDGQTLFTLRDALFGQVTPKHADTQREGWIELFTKGLKRHVEAAG